MATKEKSSKPAHPKKEFKKELAGKLETVLAELKTMLGEDEFQHRLKKAAKVLTHGLHGKDIAPETVKTTEPSPKKTKALKKAAAKK